MPEADISPSFDNFGDLLKVHWHGQAERFCGLEIDDKLEFRRPLDRQVSRLFAFENPCGVSRRRGYRHPFGLVRNLPVHQCRQTRAQNGLLESQNVPPAQRVDRADL